MTERIAIIVLVAILFYAIVPLAFRLAFASRDKRLLRFLSSANGVFAVCSAWHNETLTIDPVATSGIGAAKAVAGKAGAQAVSAQATVGAQATGVQATAGAQAVSAQAGAALPFNIAPARTRFYVLESEGTLERAAWGTISLIKRGVTLMYYPGRSRRSRGICVFHEETSEKRLRERFASLALETRSGGTDELRAKYLSVALGAFAEFLLFFLSISDGSARIVSVAALIAIFGKALPYCPPGLLFTIASRVVVGRGHPQKKNRRLAATGFALSIAGIVLNVGIVLFVIVRFAFG